MAKRDIWDVLFWIGMLILVVYIILKLAGIIHSPDWVNLIPIITITFVVGASYQKIISFMDVVYKRTDYLKKSLDGVESNLNEIKEKVSEHDVQLSALGKARSKHA